MNNGLQRARRDADIPTTQQLFTNTCAVTTGINRTI